MSRMGAKTYSRKTECKTSVQFDHLLADKGNKPSTAKVSVKGIHRWGMTSFTSIRKTRINGQKEALEPTPEPIKRKLDTTSTPSLDIPDDPFGFATDIEDSSTRTVHSPTIVVAEKKIAPKPNKFFKSGSRHTGPKNSDFDSLLTSVKPTSLSKSVPSSNCNALSDPQDGFLSMNVGYNEITHSSVEQPIFLTNTSPSIVNLCYSDAPDSRSSTNCTNLKPNVHYVSPYIHPVQKMDESLKEFDALRTSDLINKDTFSENCLQFDNLADIADSFDKTDQIESLSLDLTNRDMNHISHNSDNEELNNEKYDSVDQYLKTYISNKRNFNHHNSKHSTSDKISNLNSRNSVKDYQDYAASSQEYTANSQEYASSSQEFASNSQEFASSSQEFASSSQESITNSQEYIGSSQEYRSSRQTVSSHSTEKYDSSKASRPKKIFSSSLKFKAKYNHRHWQEEPKKEEVDIKSSSLADEFEDEIDKPTFNDDLVETIAETSFGETRSVKCPKESKQFYTVVRNVKQAYQCHESGETQEFNDDIEYLLECVQDCNGIGTRCLSVLNLAAKCMGPAFRIHLRAHGTMPKIFSALKDAPTDPNLALCTATLMFVLSQDRLTMDIEASTLSLMLQLLETDPELRNPEKEFDLILKDPALCAMQEKHAEKVFQLCEEMQQKGHAKHLKLDNLNTGILAMETLLSLTSRKAGEWFKEEMRTLHGLDHIADTVTSCVELLVPEEQVISVHPTEVQLDRIRKIDRCLRVLENVTHMNAENQAYLMSYKDLSLISTCLSLMKLCKSHLLQQKRVDSDANEEPTQKNKNESPIISCLLNLLKVLSNITYNTALNDSQFPIDDGLMDNLLVCILQVPRAVPVEKRFDLLILSLGLMINLVEYCDENSSKFIEMNAAGSFDTVNDGYEMPASESLVEFMLARLEFARVSEEQADEILDNQEQKQAISIEKKDVETAVEDLEETLMKTLQKAGKHMEHSIIAAYVVILLGVVTQKNPEFIEILRDQCPDGNFDVMVDVLKKFKSFVTLTGSVRSRELVFIQRVIQVLESS